MSHTVERMRQNTNSKNITLEKNREDKRVGINSDSDLMTRLFRCFSQNAYLPLNTVMRMGFHSNLNSTSSGVPGKATSNFTVIL